MNVREAAFLSLRRCNRDGKYSNLEVDSAIKKYGFEGNDRAFFTALVYGVIEKRITIDYVISLFSSKPVDKIEPSVLEIIRLGVYQIMFLDRIPDSAACNESVELAKLHTHKGTASFVNGILRNVARGKDKISYPDKSEDLYYSVKYSCPIWLCKLWREAYGDGECERVLEGINRNPFITLRVNTLKTSREALMSRLESEGISCFPTSLSPYGIVLDEYTPISAVTPLAEGLCIVQDESSQLCSIALGAEPGETVADTCSCPGGKSFSIAMGMENKGKIYSLDIHQSKLSLVESGAKRLGIDIIEAAVHNGLKPKEELIGVADRVLCDVPCSGLGVIAKKPDLRHKSPEDIKRLPEIQYKILENGALYVKEGGYLVYSTCTLNPSENEGVISKFISQHGEFEPCSDGMPLGKDHITFFPHLHGTDGFFVAKFKRVK